MSVTTTGTLSPKSIPTAHHLLDTSTDCVKTVGVDGTLLGMNPDGLCLMEIDDFSTVAGKVWWEMWPEPHRATVQAAVVQAVNGSVARFSADCPTAKGTPKHWDVMVSPVHADDGQVVRLLSVSRDVTREVYLANERALVTRELAHRIKNLFAIMDGMIRLAARSATDTATFSESLRSRIGGLGRSIAYIYSGKDLPWSEGQKRTLHGLVHELVRPYGKEVGLDIVVVGDDHEVSEDAITPMSLIINELATNAVKYGALAKPDGKVVISTVLRGDAMHMEWIETGGAPAASPKATGFGTTLVDRTVNLQLEGTINREWTPQGLRIRFILPTRRLA